MSKPAPSELPFQNPLVDIAKEIYLFYLDIRSELAERHEGKDAVAPSTVDYEDEILREMADYLREYDYYTEPFDSRFLMKGVVNWIEYTRSPTITALSRAIATNDESFTSLGLSDEEARFVLEVSILKTIHELSLNQEIYNSALEYNQPSFYPFEETDRIKEALNGFQARLRERSAPTPPQERK